MDTLSIIDDHDLHYTIPVPEYEGDLDNIENVKKHPTADAAVLHDIPIVTDGVHHFAEYLYAPIRDEDADGNYAIFVTNRDHVDPEEIKQVCNSYRRRWDIEIQYKSIKKFLPKTSSKDYRIRFLNFALATLIYNLWRLTDYLLKRGFDQDIREPPVITAKTFVRTLGEFLRELG
jgi:hypothetical protein